MSQWPDPCTSDFAPQITAEEAPDFLRYLLQSGPCNDHGHEIRRLGVLIDIADECALLDFLGKALDLGADLIDRDTLTHDQLSVVHFFLSNAYEGIRRHGRRDWKLHASEQPELEQQIVHLRSAVRLGSASGLDASRLCQMYTNFGNLLYRCGRVVEAVAAWDSALRLDASFSMALGNRGRGLFGYARLAHDPGHQVRLLREAYRSLSLSLQSASGVPYPQARASFEAMLKDIESRVPDEVLRASVPYRDFSSTWSDPELAYRTWCLRHRLFLNDLNDVDLGPIGAADVLTLPSITTRFDEPQPSCLGFFNQLKQEFVSARFLFYEGTCGNEAHFSDRDVNLVNTLDYPAYGLALEQVKLAFRGAYSLFDKTAYFLNDYLNLAIHETQVTFRSLWYAKGQRDKGLRQDLGDPGNIGLKGLFWLSKDLYESDPAFADAIEPDAQLLATIRNHLEHKYLNLHDGAVPDAAQACDIGFEPLAYSLTRRDFEAKTLRLLQLSRAALIYLVQAVYAEEYRRLSPKDDRIVVPMFLDTLEDDWKY